MTMSTLASQTCTPLGAEHRLQADALDALLLQVPHWLAVNEQLVRHFGFKDFHQTMAFVNAVAWVVHEQDHHPDLQLSYKQCVVSFSTHSACGLTLNDFICAARVDAILT
jgi:4a-hydroxytetrahydrobiopterin dehydratase